MSRPIAPHGIDAYPHHAVVCACVFPPKKKKSEDRFMDVLLLPAEEAARQCRESFGYSKELADAVTANGLRLVFFVNTPGRVNVVGRGQSKSTPLTVCEGGILLPGAPPPLDYLPGEAEAYPFAFLAGVDAAIREFAGWAAWARAEGIDAAALHRYVWRIPLAPPLEWFSVPHPEAELREAGLLKWSGPPEPEGWPGEHNLWLLRAEWVNDIPQGMELVSIAGKRVPFVREHNVGPGAQRGGALAFGLLAVEVSDE